MLHVTNGGCGLTKQQHALRDGCRNQLDAAVVRVQVDIGRIAASFAILRHQVPQVVAQLWHLIGVIVTAEGNAMTRTPHEAAVPAETVEHPFGTMKARMGATHFLTKTLPKVAAEMALSVLAYNLTRVMNIVGSKQLMAAILA